MSEDHDHPHREPEHGQPPPGAGSPASEDAGAQALAEAFRSSFFIVRVVMVILVAVFFCSGFFTVGPQERAVILRFGRTVGEGAGALLGPGSHWAFPRPIDEVIRIPFTENQTVRSTVGWYYMSPDDEAGQAAGTYRPQGGASLNPARDGYTITGDGNIIHTRATLTYRVEDPNRYEFGFVNASNAVRDALDNALIYVSARFTNVDDVLRSERQRFREAVSARVAQLAQQEDLGIAVQLCDVDSIPPVSLQPRFEAVTTALSDADTAKNDAEADQNAITNAAAAEAVRRISAAETARTNLVASVKAEADVFTGLLPEYNNNPGLVKSILYYQTIAQVMTNVSGKWYMPENPGGEPWEIRLQLSRPPLEPVFAPPAAGNSLNQ
jgi:modulator of FtsH protease HflK